MDAQGMLVPESAVLDLHVCTPIINAIIFSLMDLARMHMHTPSSRCKYKSIQILIIYTKT
jgi:hypothetical protein